MGVFLSKLEELVPSAAVSEVDLEQARQLRQQAFALQDEARQYAEQSQRAYREGDGAEAKRLSELKHATHARADGLHDQAEKAVFAFYNDPARLAHNQERGAPGDKWVDFHELLQKEVLERLNAMRANPGDATRWVLIVGRGNHSQHHGHPVLKAPSRSGATTRAWPSPRTTPPVGCITVLVGDAKADNPFQKCCPVV